MKGEHKQDIFSIPLALSFSNLSNSIWTVGMWLWHLPTVLRGNLSMEKNVHSLRKSLTKEDFDKILNHIDIYVEYLLATKLKTKLNQANDSDIFFLSVKQSQLIAELIKENFEKLRDNIRDISAMDLDELAQIIFLKLQSVDNLKNKQLLKPTSDQIAEISRLVKRSLDNEWQSNQKEQQQQLINQLDVQELMKKILHSALFINYLDENISDKMENIKEFLSEIIKQGQNQLISNLQAEISTIQSSLSSNLAENRNLQHAISKLERVQDELEKRMNAHEFSVNERFVKLLRDVTAKLVSLKDENFSLLNQQIKLSIFEMLGLKFSNVNSPTGDLEEFDFYHWLQNLFVAKDYLEERLLNLTNLSNKYMHEEINRSSEFLMREVINKLNLGKRINNDVNNNSLNVEDVYKIVKSVLDTYDADKTGLVDFALESAGGQILSTRCTENYQTKSAQISIFGIPLWYPSNTPRVAISPNVQPGECWAFQGFPGFLVLKLNSLVYVTGFTLEHIPKTLAPNGNIDSAPKNFTVWGLLDENDKNPVLFGNYAYLDNGASLQYFPTQNLRNDRMFDIVELSIESNHGHPLYTCLYRFRVHGKPTINEN